MRGYLSPFYDPDTFPIFEKIGINQVADLEDCMILLKEISEVKEVTDTIRAIINNVYLECERLLAVNVYQEETTESFGNLNLMTRAGLGKYEFSNVKDLVFADDEQLADIFAEDRKILWLGCAYSEVSKLLEALSIEPLSSFVEVEVSPIDVTDVPLSIVETVREWKHYLDLWTKFKKPKLYTTFIGGLEKLGKIQILEAQEIRLKYKLEAKSVITKSLTRDVYYDKKQNKLYLNASLDAYSPKIASELCRIFVGGEALKEPVLALLSTGDDDEKRIEVFEQFGIPKEGLPRLIMERIEPKQVEETEEDTIKSTTEKLKPTETEEERPESIKITIPQIFSLGPLLINPDDYTPNEIKELEVSLPSNSSESAEPLTRVVRAKHKTHPPTRAGARRRTIKVTMSPQLPEDVAFELVKKFEESEKRITDDSPRDQKNVGYDLSSSDGISKRFIDIKSSKYDNLVITIQRSEWRKAELEGDNYYLYIVTGLRAGGTPTLQIIQNPIKYLKPDITSRINISNWVHAVRFEISYSKIDETQP